METKIRNIKTKRPKNILGRTINGLVADICQCSTRQVNYIRHEQRGKARTDLQVKVALAIELLDQKIAVAINETAKAVQHPSTTSSQSPTAKTA